MGRTRIGRGNWGSENNDFILRNVLYLLYGSDKPDGSPGIMKNLEKADCFKSVNEYQYFLDLHFAGYLSHKMKNATYLICGIDVGSYTNLNMRKNTYADLMGGKSPSKCKGRGSSVRNALIEKIKADGKNKKGIQQVVKGETCKTEFSKVIDDMEYVNYCILKAWDLKLDETVAKLNNFMKRMEEGETGENKNLIEFPSEMKAEIFSLIQNQIDQGTWNTIATAITWLLLLSLFRGEAGGIAEYYRNMGVDHRESCDREAIIDSTKKKMSPLWEKEDDNEAKKGSKGDIETKDGKNSDKKKSNTRAFQKSRYAPPDKIRPFTMEGIGNLRNTYVERTDILQVLDEMFWGGREDNNEKRYVFLSGMSGDGKSELARAYAFNQQKEYDDIFWLTCQNGKIPELKQLLKDNGYSVYPGDLEVLDEHTLLIVDNCNTISAPFLRQLHNETGQAHLLITTTLGQIVSVDKKHILPVFADEGQILLPGNFNQPGNSRLKNGEGIQENESTLAQAKRNILTQEEFAYQIFYRNYFAAFSAPEEVEKQLTDQEQENIRRICRCVGNHPMTVAMIAVMLRENQDDYSIEEFRENSRNNLREAIPSYLNI